LLDLAFEHEKFSIVFVNEYYHPFVDEYMYTRKIMGLKTPEYEYHECDIE